MTTVPLPFVSVAPLVPSSEAIKCLELNPQLTCNLRVVYPSEEIATIVHDVLCVDPELHPEKVSRAMAVVQRELIVTIAASEARFLRASVNAFLDVLALTTRTIEEFNLDASSS